MRKSVNVEDYRRIARRRLPSMIYDFLDGGALDESTLRANIDDLSRIFLQQRVLHDVADIDLSVTVLRSGGTPNVLTRILSGSPAQASMCSYFRATWLTPASGSGICGTASA